VWDEHVAIAGAIAAGDGARASRLIEQHGLSASLDLAAQLARKRKIAAIQGGRR